MKPDRFLAEHNALTRRFFLQLGAAGTAALGLLPATLLADELPEELTKAIENLESYLTKQEAFGDVSRGNPLPYKIPDEKKEEVGLTQQSWRLEVVSDAERPADLGKTLTKADGTALDWAGLMRLAEKHRVSFPKIMTCNNMGCPLGMGIWEGVPLREVVWMTEPKKDLRRVFYYGYHNDDPKQMFRSSLPIGRVLEDPFDLPPVILCYKLNGQWLNGQRGGPVRMVVPEAYGFKSVKWLSHIVLTNLPHANDTYADGNNDVDSWLKTFAATLSVPNQVAPNQPIPVTGYAQVGISGLAKVQVWISEKTAEWPADDPYFKTAPWVDAEILSPPKQWGGELPDNTIPDSTLSFDPKTGQPLKWPLRLGKAHWAALLPGLPAGEYTLRCRTIDEKGHAQPLPRPFNKSGRNSIEEKSISVKV